MESENHTEVNLRKRKASRSEDTTRVEETVTSGEKISDSLTELHVKNGDSPPVFEDFSSFKLKSILTNSADYKRAIVEAVHKDGSTGVIILDKKPFTEEVLAEFLSDKSKLRQLFQNDIYGSYDCFPIASASGNS